jgi:hypothetical protein
MKNEKTTTIACPNDDEVWLEFGWLEDNDSRNMLWYNEGNADEFNFWFRSLMTKKMANEPPGRMYFRMLVRPDCDVQIVCEPKD